MCTRRIKDTQCACAADRNAGGDLRRGVCMCAICACACSLDIVWFINNLVGRAMGLHVYSFIFFNLLKSFPNISKKAIQD